jgi:hypothetical protein
MGADPYQRQRLPCLEAEVLPERGFAGGIAVRLLRQALQFAGLIAGNTALGRRLAGAVHQHGR